MNMHLSKLSIVALLLGITPIAQAATINMVKGETYTGSCGYLAANTPGSFQIPAANNLIEINTPPAVYASMDFSFTNAVSPAILVTGPARLSRDALPTGTQQGLLDIVCADYNGPSLGGWSVRVLDAPSTFPVRFDYSGGPITSGLVISVYDSDGYFRGSKATDEFGASGRVTFNLPQGSYTARISSPDGDIWYGGTPYERKSRFTVPTRNNASLRVALGQAPTLTSVTRLGDTLTITGTGFGSARGYIDFGGFISNASSAVPIWSRDGTRITALVPDQAGTGCLRVFSKTGGWSQECKSF